MTQETKHIESGVRRTVGVAALRRLRQLVDAEQAQDRANAEAIRPVVTFLLVLLMLVAALILVVFSPRFLS